MSTSNVDNQGPVCDSCGYLLAGLPAGTKCPECGHSSLRRERNIRQTTMSFQAPSWYIRFIRYGFLLCMFSLIGGLAGPVVMGIGSGTKSMLVPVALLLFIIAGGCWTAGVWMITRSRKGMDAATHDPVLDNANFIRITRMISFAWPSWIILIVGASLIAQTGAVPMYYRIAIALVGFVAWIGLIPVCVYFAELAYWAADDRLANRLRAVAWVMMVFGVIAVGSRLLSMSNLPIADPAKFVHVWSTILSGIATIVMFYSMFRMSLVLNWALSHQRISADKHARIAARIESQMKHQGAISNHTPCQECAYNLQGLAFNGACPECGSSYGQTAQAAIRDPALDTPRHDESPIDIAESTGGQIKHRPSIGTPIEEVPDMKLDEGTGSIPLAHDLPTDLDRDRA